MSQIGRPKNTKIDEKIMNTIKNLVQTRDLKDFSMELVVKEAGIAKQTLYNRYSSKLELLLGFLNFLALEKVIVEESQSFIEKVTSIIFTTIDYVKSNNSGLLKLLAMEALKNEGNANLIRDSFINKRRHVLIKVINAAKESGEIKKNIDADTFCDMLFGIIWYRMIFNIEENVIDKESLKELIEVYM